MKREIGKTSKSLKILLDQAQSEVSAIQKGTLFGWYFLLKGSIWIKNNFGSPENSVIITNYKRKTTKG